MNLFLIVTVHLLALGLTAEASEKEHDKDMSRTSGVTKANADLYPSHSPFTIESEMLGDTFRNSSKSTTIKQRTPRNSPEHSSNRLFRNTKNFVSNFAGKVSFKQTEEKITSTGSPNSNSVAPREGQNTPDPPIEVVFNLTEAVRMDILYQDLHCPKSCDGNGTMTQLGCQDTIPRCPTCRCDADCTKYGDCCNLLQLTADMASVRIQRNLNQTVISGIDDSKLPHACDETHSGIKDTEECSGELSVGSSEGTGTEDTTEDNMSSALKDVAENGFVFSKTLKLRESYFRCFAIEKWKTVYVVTTCPQKPNCTDALESANDRSSSTINITHAAYDSPCNKENYNASAYELCASCLSNTGMVSLVTSHLTGDTYCNQYCLQCHENRYLDSSDQMWEQEEKCRSVPVSVLKKESGGNIRSCNNGNSQQPQDKSLDKSTTVLSHAVNISRGNDRYANESKAHLVNASEETTQVMPDQTDPCVNRRLKARAKLQFKTECNINHIPPPDVHLQTCDYRLKDPVVDINSCDLNATGLKFPNASNQTLMEVERLCGEHWAPVLYKNRVYRNIFCFICQGQEPSKCALFRQNDNGHKGNGMFEKVSIALLTDLSGNTRGGQDFSIDVETEDDLSLNSNSSCMHGYWKDPIKDICRQIKCSPGRRLSDNQQRCDVAEPGTAQSDATNGVDRVDGESLNTQGFQEQVVYVLNILWSDRSETKLHAKPRPRVKRETTGSSKEIKKENIKDVPEILKGEEKNKKNEKSLKSMKIKSMSKTTKLLRPSVIINSNGEIILNLQPRIPMEEESKRQNKEHKTVNTEPESNLNSKGFQDNSVNLGSQRKKCHVFCEDVQDITCASDAHPETCVDTKDGCSDHLIALLRSALSSYRSTVCDSGKSYPIGLAGDHNSDTMDVSEQEPPQQQESGKQLNQFFLKAVNIYTDSLMRQLNITEYLILHSYSRQKISDTIVQNSQLNEMNTVLFLEIPSRRNLTFLEQELLFMFQGNKVVGADGVSVSILLLSSKSAHNFKDNSFVIDTTYNESCAENSSSLGTLNTDTLTSFYKLACSHSDLGSTLKNIISFDQTTFCPFVSFNKSDFNMSDTEDDSLSFISSNGSNVVILRSDYVLDGDIVNICVDTLISFVEGPFRKTQSPPQRSVQAKVESILTVLSLSISLVSLLALFLTYSVFPSLRSLPGKNNMVLVFWLFLAQFQLWLEPLWRPYHNTCVVMGIFLHLSWLYAISWTTACSYHMCRIFASCCGIASKHSTNHRFYISRYFTACSAFSLGLVIAVIMGTGVSSDWTDLGYGGRGACYLNAFLLVLLAFVLPLALTLVFNCAFFVLTVWSISSVDAIQRQAGQERRNAHIYLRLSSLTGLCWTLALLAEIPGLSLLRCVSIVVNGSQGFLLFLSYACNRRVVRLWSNLLSHRGGKGGYKERGTQLTRYKQQVERDRSSSRKTDSTALAGLL